MANLLQQEEGKKINTWQFLQGFYMVYKFSSPLLLIPSYFYPSILCHFFVLFITWVSSTLFISSHPFVLFLPSLFATLSVLASSFISFIFPLSFPIFLFLLVFLYYDFPCFLPSLQMYLHKNFHPLFQTSFVPYLSPNSLSAFLHSQQSVSWI